MKKIVLLLIVSLFIISCTSNLFTGVGSTPDSKHPYIDITSHKDKQKVVGMVTLSGKATDDIKVSSVTVFDSVTGKDIGNANLSGEAWSYTFNTDKWSDGVAVFGARVKDKSGKKSVKTVSLILDNWGPTVIINQPEGGSSNVYYNPFQTALTLIDDSAATDVEWKIESESIPSAVISGAVTNVEHPEMANGAVTYIIDPSPISGIGGFVSGYCTLSVRAKNTKDKWSKEWATKRININFSEDDPTVYILNPTATDAASASKFGSDMYVSGQGIDDDGINYIYIYHTNEAGTVTMYTIDCTADPKKNKMFSYRLTGLNDGTHKVWAKVKDIGGATSPVTADYYFKVDSSVPSIEFTAPAQGGYYKGTFNITANIVDTVPDTIVKVETKINSGAWSVWATPNVSSYSFSRSFDSAALVPTGGEVFFYIRATDGSGNITESSLQFNVDNALPTAVISTPVDGNSELNQTIVISGTAEDTIGSTGGIVDSVKLSLSGVGGFTNVSPNGTNSWSYNFDTSAIGVTGNDPRTLTVTVTDKAGNVRTVTRVLNIDQTADFPKVVLKNLAEGDTRLGTFTLAGTSEDDDAVASVWVSLDNTTSWVKASGTTSWSALMDFSGTGSHVLYYKSVDIYGKESHQKPGKTLNDFKINFIIDMDAPEVIITAPLPDEAKGANPEVKGTVKTLSSKISKIEIKVDGASADIDWTTAGLTITGLNTYDATFSYTINSSTAGDGPTKIYVRATDAQNRVKTTDREFIIDTVKPTGSFISPSATITPYRNGIITFTGTAGDPDPSSGLTKENVQINLVGVTNGITYNMVDGSSVKISGSTSNWTYNFDLDALTTGFTDGLYKAVLLAKDKAGNVVTSTASTVINNIRISRYTPYFSSLTLNGTPVTDNMNVTKTCTFAGTIKDDNVNDVVAGITGMKIYQSDDDKIDVGPDTVIGMTSYASPTSQTFSFSYTFTSTKKYLIYELTDKVGGVSIFVYKLNIDIAPPTANFKYSSAGYAPSTVSSKPGYSASYWIKLDATDTLDGTIVTDITGSTINVKLGTTSGGDDLASEALYTVGDYFKIDLKDVTASPLYLGYKLRDKVGNVTDSSVSITVDSSKPAITSSQLSAGWVNSTTLSGTATFGGATGSSVKLTAIDETAGVNDAVWNNATGTTAWIYTLPSTPAEGEHNITVLATAEDATNMYEKFIFKFDQTPPSNTLLVTELSDSGRVVGNNLSGTVRFSGVYTDTMAEYYNTTDILLTLTIDGVPLTVPSANITKNADYSMSWYYDWNTQTHSSYNAVKNNIVISLTSRDAAGNSSVTPIANKNVVPYITTITPEIGKIVPVKGFSGSAWTNLNDNKTYTYRLGGGIIVVNGYNLNSTNTETIYYNTTDTCADTAIYYTVSSGNMNTLTLPLNTMTSVTDPPTTPPTTPSTTGYIYIKVPGTSTAYSNTKKIVYIKNYAATSYDGMADMDMVPDTSNFARVIYQKHQNAGSGLYRFTETAEGTFNRAYNQNQYIFHGFNRFWFVNVTKDIGTSSQGDGTYYLFTCDSENRDSATKGLQLIGNSTMFDTLPGTYQFHSPYDNVKMPNNDYNEGNIETRRNRWRMSTYNTQTGNPYVTDWNVSWGDTVAKNDIVYTAWYDELGSKLHYRRLNNNSATNTTVKSPVGTIDTDSSIIFNIKGMYPSITLDNSGYPVIACFDDINGNLVVLYANSADPQKTEAFTQYTIDSAGVVGAYPAIKISETNIHIAYQDITNGYLKYAFGTSIGSMSTIELDVEGTPGYKCDMRLDGNNKPVITYIANSYIGTGNAVRVARFTDGSSTAFTDRTKWEVLTLPCERNITTNKVRGYITGTSTIFGFAKSGGTESGMPEFFREKP